MLANRELRNIPGANVTNFAIETRYAFDGLRRITHTYKKWAGSAEKRVSTLQYDAFGRVGSKRLSPDFNGHFAGIGPAGGGLEALQYSYNIQGTVVGINKQFALKEAGYNKWGNFFGMYFGYTGDPTGVFGNSARLNGQLRGLVWNTQGDDNQRKYEYAYDNAGRLTAANFTDKPMPTSNWANTSLNFSTTNLAYTLNGNLTALRNMGVQIGSPTPVLIDQLAYSYNTSGRSNRLKAVAENTTATTVNGTQGDFIKGPLATTGTDYTYDANGNTISDRNKGMVNASGTNTPGILYNHLDKPVEVNIDGKGRVKFMYDANGSRVKREFISIDATKGTKVTWYFGSFELEEVVGGGQPQALELKNIYFEEGRIRVLTPQSIGNSLDALSLAGNINLPGGKQGSIDYFITDHRSDTRMILTEETQWEYVTATADDLRQGIENDLFTFPTGTRVLKSDAAGWTSNIQNSSSTHVIKVNQSNPVGSSRLLKVMAGDLVGANTKYFYPSTVSNNNTSSPVSFVLSMLATAITGSPATSGVTKAATGGINNVLGASSVFTNLMNANTTNNIGNQPKAFLNIVFFDERFNFVEEGSTKIRVATAGNHEMPIVLSNIKAPRNGYCLVYVSNESPTNVFFDDLQVRHDRGRIIEENHYYAYGLKIAALSSKAFAAPKNNYQYQGDYSEFDDDLGWNDFDLRSYDPQIGRFLQHDPYDQFASGYVGMGNDPGNMIDEDGGWSAGAIGAVAGGVIGGVAGGLIANNNGGGFWGTVGGALGGALLGAGLGYAADMSWFNSASQTKNFFTNFRAFYAGLIGKETVYEKSTIGKMFSGYGAAGCPKNIPIQTPDIWGGIGIGLQWSTDLKWVTVDVQKWINQEWVGTKRFSDYQIMDRTLSSDGQVLNDQINTRSPYNDGQNGNPTRIKIKKWDNNRTLQSDNMPRKSKEVRIKFTQDASNSTGARRIRVKIKTMQLLETEKESLKIMGIKIPFIKRKR